MISLTFFKTPSVSDKTLGISPPNDDQRSTLDRNKIYPPNPPFHWGTPSPVGRSKGGLLTQQEGTGVVTYQLLKFLSLRSSQTFTVDRGVIWLSNRFLGVDLSEVSKKRNGWLRIQIWTSDDDFDLVGLIFLWVKNAIMITRRLSLLVDSFESSLS